MTQPHRDWQAPPEALASLTPGSIRDLPIGRHNVAGLPIEVVPRGTLARSEGRRVMVDELELDEE